MLKHSSIIMLLSLKKGPFANVILYLLSQWFLQLVMFRKEMQYLLKSIKRDQIIESKVSAI